MTMGSDSHGNVNVVLKQDKEVYLSNFQVSFGCQDCGTLHLGTGFIRPDVETMQPVFRGVFEYDEVATPDLKR